MPNVPEVLPRVAELTSHGIVSRTQSVVQWFNVKDYGATGSGATDDTAAIEAAKTALKAAAGGVLYFPAAKEYKVTKQLTYSENECWIGDSTGSTELGLASDLYVSGIPPAIFIVPEGGGAFNSGHGFVMENLKIGGPTNSSVGQNANKTIGIRLNASGVMRNCAIAAFHAGIQFWGDHQKVQDCLVGNNYFSVQFPEGMPTQGDQEISGCVLTGAGLASIHLWGSGGTFAGGLLQRTHLGYSPVGILRTDAYSGWDGSGNPEFGGTQASGGLWNTNLLRVPFENCGNGGILDLSAGEGVMLQGGQWEGTVATHKPFVSPATKTYKAPLNQGKWQGRWLIYVKRAEGTELSLENWEITESNGRPSAEDVVGALFLGKGGLWLRQEFPMTSQSAAPFKKYLFGGKTEVTITGSLTLNKKDVKSLTKAFRLSIGQEVSGSGIAGGTTVLEVNSETEIQLSANATETKSNALSFKITEWSPVGSEPFTVMEGGNFEAMAYEANGTIEPGDLVEAGGNTEVKRATSTANIVGVSLTTSASSHPVLVQTGGLVAEVNCIANNPAIPTNTVLAPSEATAYKLDRTSKSLERPGVAVTTEVGGLEAASLKNVRLQIPFTARAKATTIAEPAETTAANTKAIKELIKAVKAGGVIE